MKLQEIKEKQKELFNLITPLSVLENNNSISVKEHEYLKDLRKQYTELESLKRDAELEEKREIYGEKYAKLFKECQEIKHRKGVQPSNVIERLKELEMQMEIIENDKNK
jgi:SpoVK/Ycf46/Vps4 family AAA+-type ATPase